MTHVREIAVAMLVSSTMGQHFNWIKFQKEATEDSSSKLSATQELISSWSSHVPSSSSTSSGQAPLCGSGWTKGGWVGPNEGGITALSAADCLSKWQDKLGTEEELFVNFDPNSQNCYAKQVGSQPIWNGQSNPLFYSIRMCGAQPNPNEWSVGAWIGTNEASPQHVFSAEACKRYWERKLGHPKEMYVNWNPQSGACFAKKLDSSPRWNPDSNPQFESIWVYDGSSSNFHGYAEINTDPVADLNQYDQINTEPIAEPFVDFPVGDSGRFPASEDNTRPDSIIPDVIMTPGGKLDGIIPAVIMDTLKPDGALKPDIKPEPPIQCAADADCLQHPSLVGRCPKLCIEGLCANWDKDYPPPIKTRTGFHVHREGFTLREDRELDEVFLKARQHFPEQMVKGKFFEVVQGETQMLEVKYPKELLKFARAKLEDPRVPGQVSGLTFDTETPVHTSGVEMIEESEEEDNDDSNGPTLSSDFGPSGSGVPTVTGVRTNSGSGASNYERGNAVTQMFRRGRRLTAIQNQGIRRYHVGPNQQYPWRMNGRLSMGCTAALIGNRVLLTAAHCVWDRDTNAWSGFPTFAAGQDGEDKPYGDKQVWRMTIPAGYMTCSTLSDCRAHDWAVLVLRSDQALNVGYFGFTTRKNGQLNLAGYPQSKNRELWYDHCPLHSDEGDWIKHRCDTEPGNSGSAIYTINSGSRYVVAVHGGGYTDLWNRGADVAGRTSSAGRLYDRMLAERLMYG